MWRNLKAHVAGDKSWRTLWFRNKQTSSKNYWKSYIPVKRD